MKTDEIIKNNSEILFVFEAKNTNPNGDPDDENKPRMDYDRSLNLVSDVRLKRYIRDHILNKYKDDNNKKIFVKKIDHKSVNAKKALTEIIGIKDSTKINLTEEQRNQFINKAIDVRFFGAVIPDVKYNGANAFLTGPIQFNWGMSLNKYDGPMESSGITSTFQTGKSTEEEDASKGSGAMGKDYRVGYSIIAFHGIVSANRAKHTNLSEDDIKVFDDAMINILRTEATTRSKIGQTPLIYLRIEYSGNEYFMGDLRRYIKLVDLSGAEVKFEDSDKLDWNKYKLDLTKLSGKINAVNEKISKVYLWINGDIDVKGLSIDNEKLETFPVPEKSEKQ